MNGLIDDIFKASRGEALLPELQPVHIGHWFEDLCEFSLIKAENHGLNLNCECKFEFQYVQIDPYRLRQCLDNIIDNSIKYTKHGGIHVKLTAYTASTNDDYGVLEFVVSDTGEGIEEDELNDIYSPFFRGRNIGDVRGLGLGLSIVKNWADAFGATCDVVSKRGVGTTITFTCPTQKSLIDTRSGQDISSKAIDHYGLIDNSGMQTSTTYPESLQQTSILIVDDDPTILETIQSILIEIGFSVEKANSSEVALDILLNKKFDVVLTDINLPGMNGIEFAKGIRAMSDSEHYIIGMSAQRFLPKVDADISVFNDLLEKPFDPEELVNAIGNYEEKRQASSKSI